MTGCKNPEAPVKTSSRPKSRRGSFEEAPVKPKNRREFEEGHPLRMPLLPRKPKIK